MEEKTPIEKSQDSLDRLYNLEGEYYSYSRPENEFEHPDNGADNCYYNVGYAINVLDILLKREVDLWHLKQLGDVDYKMYYAWCDGNHYAKEYIMTEEEYNLVTKFMKGEEFLLLC